MNGLLDFDRLELFALSASRDNDSLPTHLTNRLFARREGLSLSYVETLGWFRTYVADVGRVTSHSDRVVPFPSVSGGAAVVADLIEQNFESLLRSDDGWHAAGWLRLAQALKVRPKELWPSQTLSPEEQHSFQELWTGVAKGSRQTIAAAIRYWVAVRRKRDRTLAQLLAASENQELADFGAALSGLLLKTPNAISLSALAPDILVDPIVTAQFGSEGVFATLPQEILESLALKTYGSDKVRLAALDELIRADRVPESVIRATFVANELGSFIGDSWLEQARTRLYDREVSSDFIATFLSALDGLDPKLSEQGRVAIARLAKFNAAMATAFDAALANRVGLDPDTARLILTRYEGTEDQMELAEELAAGNNRSSNEYIGRLRDAGADDRTVAFVERTYELIALRYISQGTNARRRTKHVKRIRELANSNGPAKYEAAGLLLDVFSDQDIPLLVERSRYMNDQSAARLNQAVVARASLARLRSLTASQNSGIAIAAIQELGRRGNGLGERKLIALLHDDNPNVRMAALEEITKELDHQRLASLLQRYVSASGTHYYNVVCEVDRMLANMPQTTI